MTRFISWNVNGIRACYKSGFVDWLKRSRVGVLALQEVRAESSQVPQEILEYSGLEKYWFSAEKKGYSGVAILSRKPAKQIINGMGRPEFDSEGRVITAEFEGVYCVSAYFPNSQDGGKRIDYKIRFCQAIHSWVKELRASGKPVVLTGDFNIAHQAIDLARPKENEGTAGYLPEERAWMTEFLDSGWVDTYRQVYPTKIEAYSWWSARTRARERNIGWRIDYHAVSKKDAHLITGVDIKADVLGSDHCPVVLDLDVEL